MNFLSSVNTDNSTSLWPYGNNPRTVVITQQSVTPDDENTISFDCASLSHCTRICYGGHSVPVRAANTGDIACAGLTVNKASFCFSPRYNCFSINQSINQFISFLTLRCWKQKYSPQDVQTHVMTNTTTATYNR